MADLVGFVALMVVTADSVCVDVGLSPSSVEAAYVRLSGSDDQATLMFKNSLVEALSTAIASQRPVSISTDTNNNIVSLSFQAFS